MLGHGLSHRRLDVGLSSAPWTVSIEKMNDLVSTTADHGQKPCNRQTEFPFTSPTSCMVTKGFLKGQVSWTATWLSNVLERWVGIFQVQGPPSWDMASGCNSLRGSESDTTLSLEGAPPHPQKQVYQLLWSQIPHGWCHNNISVKQKQRIAYLARYGKTSEKETQVSYKYIYFSLIPTCKTPHHFIHTTSFTLA